MPRGSGDVTERSYRQAWLGAHRTTSRITQVVLSSGVCYPGFRSCSGSIWLSFSSLPLHTKDSDNELIKKEGTMNEVHFGEESVPQGSLGPPEIQTVAVAKVGVEHSATEL